MILERATMCMNCGLFGEALVCLHAVLIFEDREWKKVLPIIKLAKCQLAVNEKDAADNSTAQLLNFFENAGVVAKLEPVFDVCGREMEELIKKFIEIGLTNPAIRLNRCRVKLITKLCKRNAKLRHLELVGKSMHLIAKEMRKKHLVFLQYQGCRLISTSAKYEAIHHSFVMSEILELMNDVTTSDTSKKTMEIVWFLQSYGMCCDLLGHYERAVGVYTRAREILQVRFGSESDCYKLSGHCYNSVVESQTRAMQCTTKAFENFQQKCLFLLGLLVLMLLLHAIVVFSLGKSLGELENQTNITETDSKKLKIEIGLQVFFFTTITFFLFSCTIAFFFCFCK